MLIKERWVVLDVLKAVCVIAMIVGHNLIWWYFNYKYGPPNDPLVIPIARFLFGPLALTIMSIPFTAGIALRFFFNKGWDLKNHKLALGRQPYLINVFKTVLFLVALGFALNFFIWDARHLLSYLFSWNVLQFFALSLLVITLFLKLLPSKFLLLTGFFVLFSAPFLRNFFQSDGVSYLEMVFFGYKNGLHIWPFFPWFSIVVFGFAVANFYIVNGNKKFNALLLSVGIALLVIAFITKSFSPMLNLKDIWGPTLFQPPTLRVIGQLGFISLLLLFSNLIFAKRNLAKYGVLNVFSHGILYIYLFHFAFGFWFTTLMRATSQLRFFLLSLLIQFVLAYSIGTIVVFLKFKNKQSKFHLTDNE
ncbi:MAG: heparan-alpha-glucosaminide N-acetyltransferase domain-containing protein [Patescibacteria group bacterium]